MKLMLTLCQEKTFKKQMRYAGRRLLLGWNRRAGSRPRGLFCVRDAVSVPQDGRDDWRGAEAAPEGIKQWDKCGRAISS